MTCAGRTLVLKCVLLLLAAWLVVAPVRAQTSSARTADEWNYTAHSWQPQNGLPGETVQAFAQTPDGYLWIGTSEGLARFDGERFVLFARENTPQMRENSVFCLLAGRDGTLWIGTEGGGLVEMRKGFFRQYSAADGLTDGFIRSLYEDRSGSLWVATDNGLFRKNGAKLERIDNRPSMPSNAFHAVLEDRRGRIWAGAPKLYAIINSQPREFALDGTDSQNRVKSILETEDGSIWVGTVSGLHRLRPGRDRFERVAGVWGTIRTLCSVSGGELWAGAIGQGIFRIRFDAQVSSVVHLDAPSPQVSNTILSIFQDETHNLWVGTQVGMARLNRTPVQVLSLPQAADSDFGTVSLDADGSLWAASNQLVHVQDGQAVSSHLPGLGDARVRNLLRARDGSLWIGTDGSGLYRISHAGTAHYTMQQGLPNNFVRCMIEARDGSLWIGLDEGVAHFNGASFHNLTTRNGLVYFSTRSILEDRTGDIWVGTERGVTHLHQGQPVQDAVTEALKEEKIWALHEDADGGLWLGTRTNGLYRYRDGLLTHYTTANGLASNSVYSILEDEQHNLWLSGPLGVMLLKRAELDAQARDAHRVLSVRFYRGDAGDKPTLFYGGTQPAGVIAHGEAWFPTNRGLWRIRPTEFDVPPLTHLNIGGVTVDGRAAPQHAPLEISAGAARIEIAWEPVMLGSQEDLLFHYKLEGFDKEWTMAASTQRLATYTNLPAGHYTFLVEAWQREHPEQSVRASLELRKRPYFYRTPWFIGLCILIAGLVGMGSYQVRMRQVHARYEAVLAERTRLAREMHDTFIQGCASVSAMLEAACEIDDQESRQHMIEYASTQIRSTMDEARQAVWNLRGSEQAPSSLHECLQQMAERVGREYGMEVSFRQEGEPFALGQQAVHELVMVAREGIYNAVLHGEPQRITALLGFTATHLQLHIEDDGRGFDANAQTAEGHYGLQGMRERVSRFGGTVEISSQPGHGTMIRVEIPRARLQA
ncbi:sensor histidine kinase [Telmatobacter bradus]|uniref:sensor histidine kinase n=1 Tax=Telmatobacter bradus TaxID=474953 RepID=UPI003B4381DE